MITYKEAMELLKTERPVYYKDNKKRKITGITWRRDSDSLIATVEVLDESMNCVSIVSLDNVYTSEDEIDSVDTSKALDEVNDIIEILQNIKSCFIYENVEKVKDGYNKLMRGCIKLDEEIRDLSESVSDRKIKDMVDKNRDKGPSYKKINSEDTLAENDDIYEENEESDDEELVSEVENK